ncbi:hypothetical protein [Sulfurihydrogenibium yellowstonense]|uniref:Putative lipoprotein n=1 Tax=Sulfurihydrogenibium yellowstonense SS-5 TaxID=432331 RepID=C4FJ85_9AQUI|nr:hypothetical protein [Sulfurihydrogenibium yellowstonense]EEP60863.1 putative lipoprotein [Sulfurihydrogenibium yellowstonense SS-5]
MKKTLFLVSVSAFLSFAISCSKSDNTGQEKGNVGRGMCYIDDMTSDKDIEKCEDGSTVLFLSVRGGADLTPLIGAYAFCDLEKAVVYTGRGVVCKLDKAKMERAKEVFNKIKERGR